MQGSKAGLAWVSLERRTRILDPGVRVRNHLGFLNLLLFLLLFLCKIPTNIRGYTIVLDLSLILPGQISVIPSEDGVSFPVPEG